MGKRHSTSTKYADGTISPWLAASGPFSYSPENPPDSNYGFQYGWVMPDLFPDRRHYYFGCCSSISCKDKYNIEEIDFLIDFWGKAKIGDVEAVAVHHGIQDESGFKAPIACYQYFSSTKKKSAYLLIQHGSYQIVEIADQPHIHEGQLILYRGIGKTKMFKKFDPDFSRIGDVERDAVKTYWNVHAKAFSDSEISFSVAHARVKRSQTDFLNTEISWSSLTSLSGLDQIECQLAQRLIEVYEDSYTLAHVVASRKFGPNYVKCITPITNVRLTTYFAGEHEVLVIDPSKLEIIGTHGCEVEIVI